MRRDIFPGAWQILAAAMLAAALAGCGSTPKAPPSIEPVPPRPAIPSPAPSAKASNSVPLLPPAGSGRGGYYQDDGPGEHPPENLQAIPDPEPKVEPYSTKGNRPYVVFGKTYTPISDNQPLKQRGVGSWYGKKFHGQKTSSGEPYDMYKMTAAHPTLPIPSYARVTNLKTGAQVIVRVNDRGPFHSSRIIDLSYTAALKLGYLGKGSGELEVERLLPDEIERINAARLGRQEPPVAQTPPLQVAPQAEPARTESSQVPPSNAAELNQVLALFAEPATAQPEQSAPGFASTVQAAGGNGFYLQLGAYGQAANAESARIRLQQSWRDTLPSIEMVQSGAVYRLYGGPFGSRAEAAKAAQLLQDSGQAKPLVVQR